MEVVEKISSLFSSARLTQQILRSLKILFGFSFWGYNFVENFTGAVGTLDEYSMQNALDFIQTWTKLPLSFMLVHAQENVTSFFFRQIKIASRFSAINLCFVINVLNNKTIILLNLAEYLSPDFSQLGLWPRRLSIRRYSMRFRRIIVKYRLRKP